MDYRNELERQIQNRLDAWMGGEVHRVHGVRVERTDVLIHFLLGEPGGQRSLSLEGAAQEIANRLV